MDLDELKNELKQKLATDHAGRSDVDIAALLTKRTVSVTGKLKRSLWKEIICCIVIILAFGAVGIFSSWTSLRIYFAVFAVVCAVFLVLLVYLWRRITELSGTALPVRSNLQTIVTLIEEFMKRYFQFTMALIPICFILASIIGFSERQPVAGAGRFALKHFSSEWQVISFLLAYMLLLGTGAYFFTKWYLKKQFGRYVAQLKECIQELVE